MNAQREDERRTLEILEAIGSETRVTQRDLARRLGIALGLANLYLKRCVRKGFVKMQQAPANRYLYSLTPQGLAEKSRLTARYLRHSLDLYRRTRSAYGEVFCACEVNGWRQIVFCGVSELAEIASLSAADYAVDVLGIWDPAAECIRFLNRPVWHDWPEPLAVDAAVLTRLDDAQGVFEQLSGTLGRERILMPALFGVGSA